MNHIELSNRNYSYQLRYYYINPILRKQFLQSNETEDKSRDIVFENNQQTMSFLNVRVFHSIIPLRSI
jgi:hypothetical protein